MQVSDREASILLGATLMHWGVPFRFASKRNLTEDQQEMADEVSEKLRAVRAAPQRSPFQEVNLSNTEIALLADVVHNCLEECGNDPVELQLELQTGERQEVEALIARLRSCQSAVQSASCQ